MNDEKSSSIFKSCKFWRLEHLSDRELQAELGQLLAHGCRVEARILAHLVAIEERRLHLWSGSSSLFDYCLRCLHLSQNEAFHRITAARLAARFPVIFELVEQRKLHLTAVCLLRDYLTPDNHVQLLADASHKTKMQVLEMLARRFPRPDVTSSIRKLPAPRVTPMIGASKLSTAPVHGSARVGRAIGTSLPEVGSLVLPGEVGAGVSEADSNQAARSVEICEANPNEAAHSASSSVSALAASKSPARFGLSVGAAPAAQAGADRGRERASIASSVGHASHEAPVARDEQRPMTVTHFPENAATRTSLAAPAAKTPASAPARREKFEPLSEARYRLQLTVSAALRDKLELARGLLSHAVPSGDIAIILEKALDELIDKTQRTRFAQTESKRATRAPSFRAARSAVAELDPDVANGVRGARRHERRREHIPHETRREIVARDGLRCTFVSDSGCRCAAETFLQIHHEHAWAKGGQATKGNLRLLCAAHNRLLAEREFGRDVIVTHREGLRRNADTRTQAARKVGRSPPPPVCE